MVTPHQWSMVRQPQPCPLGLASVDEGLSSRKSRRGSERPGWGPPLACPWVEGGQQGPCSRKTSQFSFRGRSLWVGKERRPGRQEDCKAVGQSHRVCCR